MRVVNERVDVVEKMRAASEKCSDCRKSADVKHVELDDFRSAAEMSQERPRCDEDARACELKEIDACVFAREAAVTESSRDLTNLKKDYDKLSLEFRTAKSVTQKRSAHLAAAKNATESTRNLIQDIIEERDQENTFLKSKNCLTSSSETKTDDVEAQSVMSKEKILKRLAAVRNKNAKEEESVGKLVDESNATLSLLEKKIVFMQEELNQSSLRKRDHEQALENAKRERRAIEQYHRLLSIEESDRKDYIKKREDELVEAFENAEQLLVMTELELERLHKEKEDTCLIRDTCTVKVYKFKPAYPENDPDSVIIGFQVTLDSNDEFKRVDIRLKYSDIRTDQDDKEEYDDTDTDDDKETMILTAWRLARPRCCAWVRKRMGSSRWEGALLRV